MDGPCGEVLSKATPIKCSPVAFYEFFKKQANLLPHVCGSVVQSIERADDIKSWVNTVGTRRVIEILSAASCRDTAEKFTYEVEAIDDSSRKITYKLLEGSLRNLYDPFTVTLEVTNASTAQWTIKYVKKNPSNNDPDFYLQLFPTINATVDIYLRSNAI